MTHWNSLQEALTHGYGVERSFLCHVHGDSNPSASVNSLTGAWICYACHAAGRVDLDGIDLDPYAIRRRIAEIQKRVESSTVVYPEGWLNIFDARGPGEYWLSRYSEQTCREHRLGQTPDGRYATIPLRTNDGEVTGVIRRSLTGERQKYKYPWQAKLSQRLYNYHRADQDMLVLTEGATDAIAWDEVSPGYSMAMYGSRLSRAQAQLLYRYNPTVILVATDQDKAGDDAMRTVQLLMGDFCVVQRLEWDTYTDLASIPLDERCDLVHWAIGEFGLPRVAKVG